MKLLPKEESIDGLKTWKRGIEITKSRKTKKKKKKVNG